MASVAVYELRNAERQGLVLLIVPPGMHRLSIRVDQDLHDLFVDVGWHPGLNEVSRRNFELMAMPKLAFLHWKRSKGVARDDVLDAGKTSWVCAWNVKDALDECFEDSPVHQGTVMVGLQVVIWSAANEVKAI